jgi:EmrB/QacA subfamily drug resistance transporter
MQPKQVFTLISMSLAIFMFCIEYTGIVTIMPTITQSLQLNATDIQWCMLGYLLSFAVLIIISGKLGDLYGNRLILVIGLVCFTLASAFAGMAIDAWQIILARILQGLGAALMWPNTTAIAFKSASKQQKALTIGIITSVVGFAMAAGPLLAGILTHFSNWRLFFFINIPIATLTIAMTLAYTEKDKSNNHTALNFFNAFLLGSGILFLMLGIALFKSISIALIIPIVSIILGLVLLIKYLISERTSDNPLLSAALLNNKFFIVGCAVRATTNAGFYVFMFIISFYLHLIYKYTPVEVGIIFLPMTLMIGFASPIGGKLVNRFGERLTISLGLALFILTYIIFTILTQVSLHSLPWIFLLFTLPGMSYGLSSPGLLTLTMRHTPEENSGIASGFFYMFSVLGSSFGIAIATIILNMNHLTLARAFAPILIFCAAITCIGWAALIFNCRKQTN